ncbi:MAG: hypothetical protein NTW94_10095 [Legionellales bacterium]|nr:hypothetical protein [Legionellales bacterium]
MKLTKVNVTKTIADATALLEKEEQMTSALKVMFQLLLTLITLLAERYAMKRAGVVSFESKGLGIRKIRPSMG